MPFGDWKSLLGLLFAFVGCSGSGLFHVMYSLSGSNSGRGSNLNKKKRCTTQCQASYTVMSQICKYWRHCIVALVLYSIYTYTTYIYYSMCVPQMSDLHDGWLLLSAAKIVYLYILHMQHVEKYRIQKATWAAAAAWIYISIYIIRRCVVSRTTLWSLCWMMMAFLSCTFLVPPIYHTHTRTHHTPPHTLPLALSPFL